MKSKYDKVDSLISSFYRETADMTTRNNSLMAGSVTFPKYIPRVISSKNKYLCAIEKYRLKNVNEYVGQEIIVFDEKINMDKYIARLKAITNNKININTKNLDMNYPVTINCYSTNIYDLKENGYIKGFDESGQYSIVYQSRRYYLIPFKDISRIGNNDKRSFSTVYYNT